MTLSELAVLINLNASQVMFFAFLGNICAAPKAVNAATFFD